jgi:hypothetical protein
MASVLRQFRKEVVQRVLSNGKGNLHSWPQSFGCPQRRRPSFSVWLKVTSMSREEVAHSHHLLKGNYSFDRRCQGVWILKVITILATVLQGAVGPASVSV